LHPTKIHAHGITNLIKKGKSKSFWTLDDVLGLQLGTPALYNTWLL
jgi:hypothetical protein